MAKAKKPEKTEETIPLSLPHSAETDPRMKRLTELSERSFDKRAADMVPTDGEVMLPDEKVELNNELEPDTRPEPEPDPVEEEVEVAAEVDKDPVEEEEPDPVEEELETIKVDGEEQQVSRAKVIEAGKATLQKETSADKKLKEASELKKDVELLISKVKAGGIAQPSKKDVAEPQPIDAKTLEILDNLATAIDEAEEPKEIKQHLSQLVQVLGDRNISEDELTDKVVEKVRFIDVETRFKDDYSDIVDDRVQFAAARELLYVKFDAGAPTDWSTYKKVGDEIRIMFNPKTELTKDLALEERKEKKKGIDTIRGESKSALPSKDDKPKTQVQKNLEYAKMRGQKIAQF